MGVLLETSLAIGKDNVLGNSVVQSGEVKPNPISLARGSPDHSIKKHHVIVVSTWSDSVL
jgi:hypothetical protein